MYPMLKPGDQVLVDRRAYRHTSPGPDEIVVAQHPERPELPIIKRVTRVLADGRVVLEGDNRAVSSDSKYFGPVEASLIIGRVTSRFPE